ncbi:MAG: DNA polymerase III subunit beta [Chthoniobacterales bacterium]
MKFTVSKEALLDGLQTIQNVVSSRTTLPVLSNVLIETLDSGIRLTTTDLEVGIRRDIEAQIEKQGSTTLPARRLLSVIRELPSKEIQFETDSKHISAIKCGPSFFKMYGMAKEEFPACPSFKDAKVFKMKQGELKDGLKKTAYAISVDETRDVLNGILFSFKENKLTLVATDGRRLALWESDIEFPKSQERDFIVPTKAINELQRLLKDEGEITVAVGENLISLELNGALLVTKLVEGTYPNYRQVIPNETKERVTLEREMFLSCVHRVSLLSNEKSSSIRLAFTKNNLDITSNTPEIGEARESLSVPYRGRDFAIAFNPEFLMAPLRNLSDEEVYLDLADEMSPGVIKIKTPFLYVLMPMRVSV